MTPSPIRERANPFVLYDKIILLFRIEEQKRLGTLDWSGVMTTQAEFPSYTSRNPVYIIITAKRSFQSSTNWRKLSSAISITLMKVKGSSGFAKTSHLIMPPAMPIAMA